MKLLANCLGLILGGVVTAAAYASVDGSQPVICAAVEIMECVPNNGCQRISAREAGIPRFTCADALASIVRNQNNRNNQARNDWERQQVAQYQQGRSDFNRAFTACMSGRGYTIM